MSDVTSTPCLNLRASRTDCPGLSCCVMAFPRGCRQGLPNALVVTSWERCSSTAAIIRAACGPLCWERVSHGDSVASLDPACRVARVLHWWHDGGSVKRTSQRHERAPPSGCGGRGHRDHGGRRASGRTPTITAPAPLDAKNRVRSASHRAAGGSWPRRRIACSRTRHD